MLKNIPGVDFSYKISKNYLGRIFKNDVCYGKKGVKHQQYGIRPIIVFRLE